MHLFVIADRLIANQSPGLTQVQSNQKKENNYLFGLFFLSFKNSEKFDENGHIGRVALESKINRTENLEAQYRNGFNRTGSNDRKFEETYPLGRFRNDDSLMTSLLIMK